MREEDPVSIVKGIGPKMQQKLQNLGIVTVGDLIRHYPREYRSFGEPLLPSDTSHDNDGAAAYRIRLAGPARHIRRGRMELVTTSVPAGDRSLQINWYHTSYIARKLIPGEEYIFYGRVVAKGSRRVLEHPEILQPLEYLELQSSMQPVYALTSGVTLRFLTKTMHLVLEQLDLEEDFLPASIRKKYQLSEQNFAIRQIHFPENAENYLLARRRLAFDEFFLFSLSLRMYSQERKMVPNAYPLSSDVHADFFLKTLPYSLTGAQKKAFDDIDRDMRGPYAMNRLVQGDVGSGKTIVAALALMENALSGCQGCLMAPTEVLAEQHYEKFCAMFDGLGLRTVLLTGSMKASQKKEVYKKIESHEADIIIGTHALFQDKATYDHLTLIVTDEQHRFGVRQREKLAQKSSAGVPHVLVMSATPIPRTLAQVLYSDLDISVIDEKPRGRLPIKNAVVDTSYRRAAYRLILQQVKQGNQAYVICPLVEESEGMDAENVKDYTKMLQKLFGKEVLVAALHGRMKGPEKNRIMEDFAAKKIDVLVSTTVIEVGVDVPSATVMLIENSERFGLAQLHQLRGRIGRGKDQSYCIFMYGNATEAGVKRLEIMGSTNDGFEIAEQDMRMRGPGDIFGVRQSGQMEFRIGDVLRDSRELMEAGEAARMVLDDSPDLSKEEYTLLRKKVFDPASITLS